MTGVSVAGEAKAGSGRMMGRAGKGASRVFLFTLALSQMMVSVRAEDASAERATDIGIFEMPQIAAAETIILSQARAGHVADAAVALDALLANHPESAQLRVTRAFLAEAVGDREAAVAALLEADQLGAVGLYNMLQQRAMRSLADDPRLAGLDRHSPPRSASISPALVREGKAPIEPGNTGWDPVLGRLFSKFLFPPILSTYAFAENPPPGPYADLQRLVARGKAAGNVGDLYDNRDRGHSALNLGRRTQLSRIVYGPEAKAAGIDYGLNTQILFDAPTFGNSSTAITGGLWRSQSRFALTTPGGAFRLWQLYANNHIYVFPEHQDHDPQAEGGHGDLIPANTPYMLVSQGSSGSDQLFLRAIRAILAAFRPEVKETLVEQKLIAPMVQQIFRRGQKGLGDADYFGPRAHPSVFRGEDIDLAAMIRFAQAVKMDEIPPMVTLRMVSETPPHPSIFADGLNEILFDTPAAIARLWRGAQHDRHFEMEAVADDLNGRPLTFHWRVLRGDADRIAIEPLDGNGARVRITLPWHQPASVPGRPELVSSRVDIAVFADNGVQISAPAFFSMLYPAHEGREYAGDGQPIIVSHSPPTDVGLYADPLIWPRRGWTDVFDYDAKGRLLGWTRSQAGNESRFTAHGLEVLETDIQGRASVAGKVDYRLGQTKGGGIEVTPVPSGQRFRYLYADEVDRLGRPVPVTGQD